VQDPECYDRRSEKKNGTTLKIRRQFPVRIKSCMCYYIVHALYICSNDCVLYISCSAPNNLLEQYYVDTTLANTSGRAANSATAGGSSRKPNVGGRGKWSTSSSPIAHRFSAARPLQPSGLQSSPIAICDRLQFPSAASCENVFAGCFYLSFILLILFFGVQRLFAAFACLLA
jgi:hypothetical protein